LDPTLRRADVEDTGSFGAGLTRALRVAGIEVIEVTRATRVGGRHRCKNDTRDAEAAARSVLSGQATAEPKARDGIVESIRVLRNARAGAVKARTQAILHIKNLIRHGARRAPRSPEPTRACQGGRALRPHRARHR
jgi:transposase